jgi:uncharacterized membrane protein YqjE
MINRLRAVLATLVDGMSSRFDLASVELEDLIVRVGLMAALMLVAALAAAFALVFVSLAIVLIVPAGWQWLTSLIMAVLYGSGAAWAVVRLRREVHEMPAPFATTRDVLRRDAASLRSSVSPSSATVDDEP